LEQERVELKGQLGEATAQRDKVTGELHAIQSKWVYRLYKKTKSLLTASK